MSMKVIEIQKKPVNLKEFVKRRANEADCANAIDEDFILVDNGVIKAVYKKLDSNPREIVSALNSIKYDKGKRTRGLVSTSRIIGYRPRNTIRQDYCSSTALSKESPKEHKVICDYARFADEVYQQLAGDSYKNHKAEMEKVKSEWQIPDTVFTSGIVNKNNPLKYHFDTGNFTDVMSCMLTFRSNLQGGYLSLPEYDLMVKNQHNSVFIFDGQSILHGVTPFKKMEEPAFRYTIVFYSLKNMWQCLEIDDELIRIRNKKTEKEKMRADMPKEHRQALLARFGKQ